MPSSRTSWVARRSRVGRLPPEPAHGGARSRRSTAQGIRTGKAQRPRRSRRSGKTASATSSRWQRGSQTIGWMPWRSTGRPGGQLLDHDTDSYYKIPARLSTGSPWAISPGTPSSTTSRCTGRPAPQRRRPGRTGRTDEALAAALASGQPPPAVTVPVGFTTFPGEIWASRAAGSRRVYPRTRLFQRGRQGRPLRRPGGARAVLGGAPGSVQLGALTGSQLELVR